MTTVIMPEKKNSSKSLFQAAGTAVGAYFGGPAGASAGYSAGGAISDTVSPAQQMQGVQSKAPTAIDRRVSAQQAQSNPSADLAAAEAATAKLPPELQKEYMPAIQKARALDAQQRRGME